MSFLRCSIMALFIFFCGTQLQTSSALDRYIIDESKGALEIQAEKLVDNLLLLKKPPELQNKNGHPALSWLENVCASKFGYSSRYSADELQKIRLLDYHLTPGNVVDYTNFFREGENCSYIHVPLRKSHLSESKQTKPVWLHESPLIGSCPSKFILRDLGNSRIPRKILEVKCLCGGETCAGDGYECLPITRQIFVLVEKTDGALAHDIEEVTVSCACIRRPSLPAHTFELPIAQP